MATQLQVISPAREYLLDQLVIAAVHLAATQIHDGAGIPFCQTCHMSGIGGRPIPHPKSCEVGRVFSAIEDLREPACKSANQVRDENRKDLAAMIEAMHA